MWRLARVMTEALAHRSPRRRGNQAALAKGRRARRRLCQAETVDDAPTREDLETLVEQLRAEVDRLKDELRQLRRDSHEVPPHYL